MSWRIPEFAIGLILAVVIIRDVFDTVVVPGESRGTLRVARRIIRLSLPVWRAAGRRRRVPTSFAPFVLVASFVVWMLFLMLAFGLMIHSVGDDIRPPVTSFPGALYVAGTGLLTLGLGGESISGLARWIMLSAGFCGLAVMTMAVTYLLEVQGSIAQRDAGILKLTTTSGEPPSGIGLLERYAQLGFQANIPEVMRSARDWCAHVLQSHASHPSLVYFRSKGTGSGWPAALGALMDLAATVEFLLDAPEWRGMATLLREDGARMARTLTDTIGLCHEDAPPDALELDQLIARLARAGYVVKLAPDRQRFSEERARHAGCVRGLANHLGTPESPLLGAPGRRPDPPQPGSRQSSGAAPAQ